MAEQVSFSRTFFNPEQYKKTIDTQFSELVPVTGLTTSSTAPVDVNAFFIQYNFSSKMMMINLLRLEFQLIRNSCLYLLMAHTLRSFKYFNNLGLYMHFEFLASLKIRKN
jgi:hypothetical protein